MSKIQEALKKIRQEAPPPPTQGTSQAAAKKIIRKSRSDESQSRQKITVGGQKHCVDREALIEDGLLAPLDNEASVADQFRRIKRPILENAARTGKGAARNQNVIMITSAFPNAGKTFCSTNLALSISLERELNVLLADVDVAKSHISQEFGLGENEGLIDLLLDDTRELGEFLVRTDLNDIQVLPAGQRHPQATELLASDRMSGIIDDLSSRYKDRIVVMDSPPLLITSEAQALADQVGQVVIVVESGETTHQALKETIELLNPDLSINIILNKCSHLMQSKHLGGGYGYYGY